MDLILNEERELTTRMKELQPVTTVIDEVAVYPIPPGIPTSDRYRVRVRPIGGT